MNTSLTRALGFVFTLTVLALPSTAQTVWTGAGGDSDWFTAGNWSPTVVPTSTTFVTIPDVGAPGTGPAIASGIAECRRLTIENTETPLTVAMGATLEVHEGLTPTGGISGEGLVRMVGPDSATLTAGALPNLEIDKSTARPFFGVLLQDFGNPTLEITGDLTLTSGGFGVSNGSVVTVTVGGSANFAGGFMQTVSRTGIIEVTGDVVFGGTECVAPAVAPTIVCHGNFSSRGTYAPRGGIVRMAGTTQTIETSSVDILGNLEVEPFASVTWTSTATPPLLCTSGRVTIESDGTLNLPQDSKFDENLMGDGTLAISAEHEVAGWFTIQDVTTLGGQKGTVTLTGANGSFAARGIYNLVVNKVDPDTGIPGQMGVQSLSGSDIHELDGNFTLTQGAFVLSNNRAVTINVRGSAFLQGGVLQAGSRTGTLDVDGNVTLSGTRCEAPTSTPIIVCGGDWDSNIDYAPREGALVRFEGSGTIKSVDTVFRRIEVVGATALRQFHANTSELICDAFTIDCNATLDLASNRLRVENTSASSLIRGTLKIGAGGELSLNGRHPVQCQPEGVFHAVGASLGNATNYARVIGTHDAGEPGYRLTLDGTVEAQFACFEGMSPTGIIISSGATLNTFSDLKFSDPTSTPAVLLDLDRPTGPTPTTIDRAFFEYTLDGLNPVQNVRTDSSGGDLKFQDWGGNVGGEDFDDDPLNKIEWCPTTPAECWLFLAPRPGHTPIGSSPHDLLLVQSVSAIWPVTIPTVPVLPIPNWNALLGLDLYFQVAMFNPQVFPLDPLQMSNGLKATIGGDVLRYGAGSGLDLWASMPATPGALFQPAFRIAR